MILRISLVALTLLVIAGIIIVRKAHYDWAKLQTELADRGEFLNLADHQKSSQPAGKNLADSPFWKEFASADNELITNGPSSLDTKYSPRRAATDPCAIPAYSFHSIWTGHRPPHGQESSYEQGAKVYLAQTKPLAGLVGSYRQALLQADFINTVIIKDGELQSSAPLTYKIKAMNQLLARQCSAHLVLGNHGQAFQLMVTLAESLNLPRVNGNAVKTLLAAAGKSSLCALVRQAIDSQAFSASQLAELDRHFAAVAPAPEAIVAMMRSERCFNLGAKMYTEDDFADPDDDEGWKWLGQLVDPFYKINVTTRTQDMIDDIVQNQAAGEVLLHEFIEQQNSGWMRPLAEHLGDQALFAHVFGGLKYLQSTNQITMARIAIAIELHRLKTGRFPSALSQLEGEYFTKTPVSAYDGTPFRYQLIAGRPEIDYSPPTALQASKLKVEEKDISWKINQLKQ
ncbi:hypothetical protein [Persicirhabdus sediminis]|uniref:Uncharacterized protein n=1 Tax=Persicirhabdus sediminis TaxID=454144 RepID=A0A8J7MF09_9BACT|nr:hypothetical protein [Persicirhabdus sediminis]MBK1791495.1 hypothetical protein [Persicirhabdus sediminis]